MEEDALIQGSRAEVVRVPMHTAHLMRWRPDYGPLSILLYLQGRCLRDAILEEVLDEESLNTTGGVLINVIVGDVDVFHFHLFVRVRLHEGTLELNLCASTFPHIDHEVLLVSRIQVVSCSVERIVVRGVDNNKVQALHRLVWCSHFHREAHFVGASIWPTVAQIVVLQRCDLHAIGDFVCLPLAQP